MIVADTMKKKLACPGSWATSSVILLVLLAFSLPLRLGGPGEAACPLQKALALGEGFQVTEGEVAQFQAFMDASTRYRTTAEHYLQACVKYRLFSLEAKAARLHEAGQAIPEDPVAGMVQLAERYLAWRLDGVVLPEVAIVSYFRANPDLFGDRTLDDELRFEIRQKILGSKRQQIEWRAFDELKEKYKVRFYNPQTGKFEEQ